LIDGDPGPDQEAIHQEREWDASYGPPPTDNDRGDADLAAPDTLVLGSFHSGHQFGIDAHDWWRRVP
jgi:hypothetical protein